MSPGGFETQTRFFWMKMGNHGSLGCLVTWQWGNHCLGAHCWEEFVSTAKILPSATWQKFLTPGHCLHTQCFLSVHLSHPAQCLCLFSSFFLSPWLLIMPVTGSSWSNKDALTFEGWNMYTEDDQACAWKEVRDNTCHSRGSTHPY